MVTDAARRALARGSAGSRDGAAGPARLIIAFVGDQDTETALREGLLEAVPQGFDIRRGTVRAAMAALQKMPTPHTLIVDVSGEDQPLSALSELSDVVEPDVRVLVIGDRDDLNFYRQVTRGLGVLEYLYQPLMRDMVARYFGPLILQRHAGTERVQGGRVVTVTGARGGTGASTIAANLAWHFGVEARRHTVLLDADLHRGTAAMLLGAKTGPGLRTALEAPDRIDELFVERAAQPVSKRLHVLAGEEKLTETVSYTRRRGRSLLDALRRRYNFVVIDVPCSALPLHRDLLMLAHQRVLVMDPTLAVGARHAAAAGAAQRADAAAPRRAGAEPRQPSRRPEPAAVGGRAEDEARHRHPRPAQGGRSRRQHGRTGDGCARRFPQRDAAAGARGGIRAAARQRGRRSAGGAANQAAAPLAGPEVMTSHAAWPSRYLSTGLAEPCSTTGHGDHGATTDVADG